jgi:GDP-L-fucose synthase
MLRKFHEAKMEDNDSVELWGTGSPRREFLHVDDLADACLYFMNNFSDFGHINIGTGEDVSIKELAEMIREIVGFQGEIVWNTQYPDGTPRKLMSVDKAKNAGWVYKTLLEEGLRQVYSQEFAKD